MMNNKPKTKVANKGIKIVATFIGFATIVTGTAVTVSSCTFNRPGEFVYSSSNNFLENQNSPLNPTFSSSPLDSYALSSMAGLTTYETTGQFQYDVNGERMESTQDNLKLEAAIEVTGYDAADALQGTLTRNGQPITKDPNYDKVVSNSVKYVFKIDTNMQWVDRNGVPQANLSSHDFERGLETYILGSALAYQRNSYFIDLVGLDIEKTLGVKPEQLLKPSFNVNDYYNKKEDTYTIYLKEPYPYFLSILTKTYFMALPHTNPYVQAIKINENNSPIGTMTDKKGRVIIDQANTNFDALYGAGSVNSFLDRTWFLGPYYMSQFTNSQIVSELNPKYMDIMGPFLDASNGQKIKRIILNYGSGNPEVFYNRFLSKQASWLDSIPNSKRTEAATKYATSGELYLSGIAQINQSNYIAQTPVPYIYEKSEADPVGRVSINKNVSAEAAKIIFNYQSKESRIFRAALAGLINHAQLSRLAITSGDFQYSNIPFGVFRFDDKTILNGLKYPDTSTSAEYYDAIADGKLMGGLPRPYVDYETGEYNSNYLFEGKFASFKVPYYSVSADGKYQFTELEINQNTFIDALKASGATKDKPAVWQYKYGEGSVSTEYQNYLNRLQAAIEALGGGYIKFNLVPRAAQTPSASDWYRNRMSSMGYSYWAPDYNGVGTWLEATTMMNDDTTASTNTYSTFPSIFKLLIACAKDTNATVDANGATVGTPNNPSIFANDPWVNKFGPWANGTEFAKIGVKYLNHLIKYKVLDGNAISALLKDTKQIQALDQSLETGWQQPTTLEQLHPLLKYFDKNSKDAPVEYAKYLGIFAGENQLQALWLTVATDMSFSLLPRSEAGANEIIFSLVDKNFKVRKSGVGALNLRDFTYLGN